MGEIDAFWPRGFMLTEADHPPGPRSIEVEGELDLAVSDELRRAIDRSPGSRSIRIDLERCPFIDSSVIAVLVRVHRERGREGGALMVSGASGQVLRLLTVTGLTAGELISGVEG